ncbi:MAG: DUF397 domain-containing protein [Pseudonocardia sp.]|nr:DUF397 domain-containing protein [Pseudonocardia sp.]
MKILYRKSSFSKMECVEVAPLPDGTISLRDSKDTSRAAHAFTPGEWAAFVAGVKVGEFDFDLDIDALLARAH